MIVKKLALAGILASTPVFAMADPIAASLGASFGDGLDVALIDVPDGLIALVAPQSVSVSAASGDRVTASAVATEDSSGALAAATTSESNIFAAVEYNDEANAYESSVTFGLNTDLLQAALDELQAQIDALGGDIDAINTTIAGLPKCGDVVNVTGTGTSVTPVTLGVFGTTNFNGTVAITGTGTLCNNTPA